MVYDLYVFDRKLRLLVFYAIERLEIAIRTQIIYQLSLKIRFTLARQKGDI